MLKYLEHPIFKFFKNMLTSAFLLGFAGSLHCVGMCGPIALAIPMTTQDRLNIVFQSLLYQFGRISTYALLGGVLGFLGWGVALAGYQKGLSVGLGIFLIIAALFPVAVNNNFFNKKYQKGTVWLKRELGKALSITGNSAAFKIGLLNGILPCGLVYMALIGAVASGDVYQGMFFMSAFGFGTLPMMTGVLIFRNALPRGILNGFQKLIPVFLIGFALLLIWRGIRLEVPLEIEFWESNNYPILCH